MGEQVKKEKTTKEEPVSETKPKDLKAKGEELKAKADDIADLIDDILDEVRGEKTHEQFVSHYQQRGGE